MKFPGHNSKHYTLDEDTLILAANTVTKLRALMSPLGRSYSALQTRRTKLRYGRENDHHSPDYISKPDPIPKPISPQLSFRLARPSWFAEDISILLVKNP